MAAAPRIEIEPAAPRVPVKKSHSFRADLSAPPRVLSLGMKEPVVPERSAPVIAPAAVAPAGRHFAKHAHVSTTRLGDDTGRPRRLKHKSASLDSISSASGIGGSGSIGSSGSSGGGGSPGPVPKSASVDSVDSVAVAGATSRGVTVHVRATMPDAGSHPDLSASVTVRAYAPLSLPVSGGGDAPAAVTVAVPAPASMTVPVPAPAFATVAHEHVLEAKHDIQREAKSENKAELIIESKRLSTPEPEKQPEPEPELKIDPAPPAQPTVPPPASTPSPEPVRTPSPTSPTPATSIPAPAPESTSEAAPGRLRREVRPAPAAATEPAVPEFFRVRLNRVDSRPAVNVVLTTGAGTPGRGRLRSADEPSQTADASLDAEQRRISLQPRPTPALSTVAAIASTPAPAPIPESHPESVSARRGSEDSLVNDTPAKTAKKDQTEPPARRPEDAAILVKVLRKGEEDRSIPAAQREVVSFRKTEDPFTKLLNNRWKETDENAAPEPSPALIPTSAQITAPVIIPPTTPSTVFVKAVRKKEEDAQREEAAPTPRKADDLFAKLIRRKEEEEQKERQMPAEISTPRKSEETVGAPFGRTSIIAVKKKDEDQQPVNDTAERIKAEDNVLVNGRVLRRREDEQQLEQQQGAPLGRRLRLKSEDEPAAPVKRLDAVATSTTNNNSISSNNNNNNNNNIITNSTTNSGPAPADAPSRKKSGGDGDSGRSKTEDKDSPLLRKKTEEPPGSATPEVVMRRKSAAREVGPKREEEPELLKVFARRSLKLKDNETDGIAPAPATAPVQSGPPAGGGSRPPGRDSDKENEGGDSPREERRGKATPPPQQTQQPSAVGGGGGTAAVLPPAGGGGRTSVLGALRNRGGGGGGTAAPEEAVVLAVCQKENTTAAAGAGDGPGAEDATAPQFKRIQQRKEEWELRAQAARKALP